MEFIYLIIPLAILAAALFVSHIISSKAYTAMVRSNNSYAAALRVFIFLGVFLILFAISGWIFLANIRIER